MDTLSKALFRLTILAGIIFAPNQLVTAQEDHPGAAPSAGPVAVRGSELGETINVHSCGDLFLAGQFSATDIEEIQTAGICRVISLRSDGEISWDEPGMLKEAGLEFVNIPFREPDSLTDEIFDQVRQLLNEQDTVTLLHCGSASRVGAVWLTSRVLDQGVPLATAIEESKIVGLRSEAYLDKALRYIRRKQIATDLPPMESDSSGKTPAADPAAGINDSFLDPDLSVDKYIQRFEIESREVYSSRAAVLQACGIQPGQRVVDIGAGTGLYTRMFARATGSGGWVFAVDIAPRFIEHINVTARQAGLQNVSGILGTQASIHLPPDSVDIAFVCDTYHHFETPSEIVGSIYQAVKPGGQLVVVDFERIPGVTREWIITHVRAGKAVFRNEIELAGFQFVEQVEIPGFAENYFLRFRKE